MPGIPRKLIFISLLFINGIALAYMIDTQVYAPPVDYNNPLEPRIGYAYKYRDPVFNPVSQPADWIWRATDARNTPDANGTNLRFITHEYSTTSPFNRDKTRLLLVHQSYFALYDGDGNFIRNLAPVCPLCAPRW